MCCFGRSNQRSCVGQVSDVRASKSMSAQRAWALAVALVLIGSHRLHAQLAIGPAPVAPNAVFAEVGGPGGFYSANYDRLVNSVFSVRVGGTSWSTMSFDKQGEKLAAGIIAATVRFDVS